MANAQSWDMRARPDSEPSALPPDAASALGAAERERWSRTKAVFLEALDYEEPERSEFVRRECGGDSELLREIESLLASDRAAKSFGETPAAALMAGSIGNGTLDAPRLDVGARLGSYDILEFLSAGGMGEVYRARHHVLNREVAIKTVSGRHADQSAKRRLVREARHAAMLAHPNICAVYEVGDENDTPFIVMALVDGRSLAEVVREEIPPLDRALNIGIQVGDALAHAHAQGILHRDLKSSNVMVDGRGHAVVLDFGLAKRIVTEGVAPESTVTGFGDFAGTLSHMAPEVLQGGHADARSDVWSFGVLLFELLTGELPFTGRTPFETSSAILSDPPHPMPRRVPLALRLIVERCLAKDSAARYQRASDVRDALIAVRRRRAWPVVGRLLMVARWRAIVVAAASVVILAASITVWPVVRARFGDPLAGRVSTLAFVPLQHAANDADAEYYAAGITGALIGQIGALSDVRIISAASAGRVVESTNSRADAARQLGADAFVEGRLRKSADQLVVDMRLVEPGRGRVVWSQRYERSVREALVLQSDIARALAAELRLSARPAARGRITAVRTVNPEAYEAYLKGRFEWNKRTRESLQLAVSHFRRAVDLDPTYAPAHAALADCYNQFGTLMVGTGSPKEFRPKAAEEAIAALQIDPFSAEAHATLGYVRHYDWQWNEAEHEFRRAIELDPNNPLGRIWYANLLMSRRRFQEALEQAYFARDLDPFSLIVNTNVAWVLTVAGRNDEAIAQLRQTLALDSTYWHAHWRLVIALLAKRQYAEALAEARTLVRLVDEAAPAVALLAEAEAAMGDTASARARVRELVARSRREYVPPGSIAAVFARLGDVENQLRYTKLAFDERSNWVVYTSVSPELWKRYREYQELVTRAGLR